MRDPYTILGVKRNANNGEIKAAWKQKAKSLHPDANREDPDATQKFTEVGKAYEVLKDQAKRDRYDHLRKLAEEHGQTIMQQRQAAREAEERARAAKIKAEAVLAELARAEAENAKAQKAKAQAESAVAAKMKAESAAAAKPQADTKKPAAGRPADSDAAPEAAAGPAAQAKPQDAKTAAPDGKPAGADGQTQGGQRSAEEVVSHIFGDSPEAQAAAESLRREGGDADAGEELRLGGPFDFLNLLVRRFRGAPPPERAPDIKVDASVTIEDLIEQRTVTATLADGRAVKVALEGGLSDDDTVRLKGQGLKLAGMARGDVVATIRVAKSERFQVDGLDLRTVLPVTLENAVLGCDMTVETPTGSVPITIPAWSGSDQVVTLEGHGLPDGTGERGALKVELRVLLWEKPDEKVTDLMRLMREGLYL